jgi:phospholipid/cholesterol/gamma-HCH transport system substrate-binding protein
MRLRRRDEVLVGLFTTVALIILALTSIWLVRGGLSRGYPLHSRFSWGAGIKQGAPVWLVGVTVGTVDMVELDPRGTLVVTYRVQSEFSVPRGTTAAIVPNGLFGDMAVALTPEAPNEVAFAPGDTVPVDESATGLQALLQRADTLTGAVGDVLKSIKLQMVDSGGIAEMRRATASMNRLVTTMNEVAQLQSQELQATLQAARSRIAAVDSAVIDSTVRAMQASVASMEAFTSELSTASTRFNAILAQMDSGDGSMAKLLRDPALYNDFRGLLARVDSLMLDMMANPRRWFKFSVW